MKDMVLTHKLAGDIIETYRIFEAHPEIEAVNTLKKAWFYEIVKQVGFYYFGQTDIQKIIALLEELTSEENLPQATVPENIEALVRDYERLKELQAQTRKNPSIQPVVLVQAAQLGSRAENLPPLPQTQPSVSEWVGEQQVKTITNILVDSRLPKDKIQEVGNKIHEQLILKTKGGPVTESILKEVLQSVLGYPKETIDQIAQNITESGLFSSQVAPATQLTPVGQLTTKLTPLPAGRQATPPSTLPHPPQTTFAQKNLYLLYKPKSFVTNFLDSLGQVFGIRITTSEEVISQAFEKFQEVNPTLFPQGSPVTQTIQENIASGRIAPKERLIQNVSFTLTGPQDKTNITRIVIDPIQAVVRVFKGNVEVEQPIKLGNILASPQVKSFFQNIYSKTLVGLHRLLISPNLGWLRLYLGGALSVGALVMPIALPFRVIFGFGGITLLLAQARLYPKLFTVPFNAVWQGLNVFSAATSRGTLAGAGTISIPAPKKGLGLVLLFGAVPTLLILLTLMSINNSQSTFLKEGLIKEIPVYESPYIGVTKTIDPPVYTGSLPFEAKYTIKITAKDKKLTNINTSDTFSVFGENNPTAPSPSLPSYQNTLAPGQSIDLTFSVTFGTQFKDSVVTNNLTVKADVEEGPQGETVTRSASLQIGNPKTGCFSLVGNWNQTQTSQLLGSIAQLSGSPVYMSGLCRAPVKIQPKTAETDKLYPVCSDANACAPSAAGDLIILSPSLFGDNLTLLYVFAHESGHVYQYRNEKFYKDNFRTDVNPPDKEKYLQTYPERFGRSPAEDFAETVGVYVVWKTRVFPQIPGGRVNMPTEYPKHFEFAKNKIFGGFEY